MTTPEMLCEHGYDAFFCAQCKKEELTDKELGRLFVAGVLIFIAAAVGIVGLLTKWNPFNWNLF